MFTPINGPAHPGQLPSINDSTENGDSWHAAVLKVNGMFKALFGKLEAPIEHVVTAIDEDARAAIKALEDHVTALQQKFDAFTTAAYVPPQPAEPPVLLPASAPPPVEPAPVAVSVAGTAGVAAVAAALETPAL